MIRYATKQDIETMQEIINNDIEGRARLSYDGFLTLDCECQFWDPIFFDTVYLTYCELSGYSQELRFNIDRLYTPESHRRAGAGSRMLERVIEEAKNMKFKIISLMVLDWNKEAIRFYEKHGFKEVYRKPVYSYGEEIAKTVYMELKI